MRIAEIPQRAARPESNRMAGKPEKYPESSRDVKGAIKSCLVEWPGNRKNILKG
ncbi:hypothetical protein [Candidatus Solincola tengchongensis]|uniref:hypothetical protein n=1 Tax=Candidatus Solincola tengchongensis TaxID=2900693 RepID=UPI00257E3061|nr:hypothetical protein [Candidatus Solincola tengchongensis]